MARLLSKENWHASALAIFLSSSAAIIPLAALMRRATERLAERMGEGVGRLGNIVGMAFYWLPTGPTPAPAHR